MSGSLSQYMFRQGGEDKRRRAWREMRREEWRIESVVELEIN